MWFKVLLSICAVCLLLAFAAVGLSQSRYKRMLRLTGRTISIADALARIRADHGYLIRSYSDLHGDLWWIEGPCPEDQVALYDLVKQNGVLVEGGGHRTVTKHLTADQIQRRVRNLTALFMSSRG